MSPIGNCYLSRPRGVPTITTHPNDKKGQVTKVDKTWAFKKDDQGKLRIVLHHSSLPYTPEGKK